MSHSLYTPSKRKKETLNHITTGSMFHCRQVMINCINSNTQNIYQIRHNESFNEYRFKTLYYSPTGMKISKEEYDTYKLMMYTEDK